MEPDSGQAVMRENLSLSGLHANRPEAADMEAIRSAANSVVAKWHMEAQERKERQFSMYMNKKRFVVPETGLQSVPKAPAMHQWRLGLPPAQPGDISTCRNKLANAVRTHITGDVSSLTSDCTCGVLEGKVMQSPEN